MNTNDLPYWVRHCLAVSVKHRLQVQMYEPGEYQATLYFTKKDKAISGFGQTPAAALDDLNLNLVADAAQEMIDKGAV